MTRSSTWTPPAVLLAGIASAALLVALSSGCAPPSEDGAANATGAADPSESATGGPASTTAKGSSGDEADADASGGDSGNVGDGTSTGGSGEPASCESLGCGFWGNGSEPLLDCGRCDNPFAGADFYLNPEYAENVALSIAQAPRDLVPAMEVMQQQPTAVWLDRIEAIDPAGPQRGLAEHLDEALAQQAAAPGTAMTVVLVVYDLPNRDCAAAASAGELNGEEGMQRYRTEFIDTIAGVLDSNADYRKLRIVTVLEPDSLPNLVTNIDQASCAQAAPFYREGIAHAISTFSELENVYIYLDIAHSGWLGWEHASPAATEYRQVLEMGGGEDLVHGFVTNVSNYSPLAESFDPNAPEHADLLQGYFEWNRIVDEQRFVESLRAHFPGAGFIVDTGRNGWPAGPVPLEQRAHRGNWCNVSGSGIGERPRADPAPGIDAYFWVKPPGESDGTSDETQTEPNEDGKSFDPMCGPNTITSAGTPTNAMEGAPHSGQWFHQHFVGMVERANPPLR